MQRPWPTTDDDDEDEDEDVYGRSGLLLAMPAFAPTGGSRAGLAVDKRGPQVGCAGGVAGKQAGRQASPEASAPFVSTSAQAAAGSTYMVVVVVVVAVGAGVGVRVGVVRVEKLPYLAAHHRTASHRNCWFSRGLGAATVTTTATATATVARYVHGTMCTLHCEL